MMSHIGGWIKELIEKWLILLLVLICLVIISDMLQQDFHSGFSELGESIQRVKLKISLALG
ncbi:hypothetical protein ACWXWU_00555 [Shewanella sp. A14]